MMRPLLFALVVLGAVLATDTAQAEAGRTLFGRPIEARRALSPAEIAARREAFLENLEHRGMTQVGDRIIPDAQLRTDLPVQHGTGWEDPPHFATIFLNFFGGTLSYGTIASELQSSCVGALDIEYPAYQGSEAEAMTMIQVFQNSMTPYAVRIAFEEAPPAHLPYSMVMMGGDPTDIGLAAGILGVSCSSDCGDAWWRDTTFAFTEASNSALTLGNTALQEAAHAFGLDHIDGSDNIMYPFGTSGTKVWATECTPYNDATGGISCTYVHDVFCGEDAGMQHDDAELLAYFGPNEPDVTAPTVTLLQPSDGLEIDAGASVMVEVEVTDDHQGAGWRLRVIPQGGTEVVENAYQFEPSWNLAGLPDGTYTIRVEAVDHDGNEGSDEVILYVGTGVAATSGSLDDTGDPTGDPTGDATDDATDDPTGSSTGEPIDGETGAGLDDDAPPRGCACDLTAPSPAGLGLLLVVAPLRRRRRAC